MLQTIEKEPDVVFIIGDDRKKFTASIEELRRVASDPDPEDALDGYTGEALPDTGKHPVLARRQRPNKQPPRWIHVKLQVVAGDGEETSSTTLALRNDRCYGAGFMNENGVWYDLGKDHWRRPSRDKHLPPEYNSVLLGWVGDSYEGILDCTWNNNGVVGELNSRRLGKDFARAAVRTLSRYPDVEEREKPKLALAGLMIMVCESARFNPIFESIATSWDTAGMEFTQQLYGYTRRWVDMSRALLRWKDYRHDSNRWSPGSVLQVMGISRPEDALRVVYLIFNPNDRVVNQFISDQPLS